MKSFSTDETESKEKDHLDFFTFISWKGFLRIRIMIYHLPDSKIKAGIVY